MIFLNVKINGFYDFHNFEMDLTYARKAKIDEMYQVLEGYPKINYKKLNIILGANASGKTSLGKMLCWISNYINGVDLTEHIKTLCEEDNKMDIESSFSVIFYDNDHLYKLEAVFDGDGVLKEEWKKVKMKKSYSYKKMLEVLLTSDPTEIYDKSKPETSYRFKYISPARSKMNTFKDLYSTFRYSFKGYGVTDEVSLSDEKYKKYLELRENIIKVFDPSINSLQLDESYDRKIDVITFENGRKEYIDYDTNLSTNNLKLSAGTIESIHLTNMLTDLIEGIYQTMYFDEEIVHAHHTIESEIIHLIMKCLSKREAQVFYTTHHLEVADMMIPNYNYMIMVKEAEGIVRPVYPEKFMTHNSRSLLTKLIDDQFNTDPDISGLEDIINGI